MTFLTDLNEQLSPWHLLKHPFYQAWNMGELKKETLQTYAEEYYHHVAAFPRYISAIHAQCDNLSHRQVLLGNLIEEEQGEENHPELWLRFVDGIGGNRGTALQPAKYEATQELVDGYFELSKDYATGLGALYAYERQTPEVSHSKIEGLKQHYAVCDEKTLQFFSVHEEADQWHTQECAQLIEALDERHQKNILDGALKGAQLLWRFLDNMLEVHQKAAA